MDRASLKALLEREFCKRNRPEELSLARPDPLLVARAQGDEWSALICALFAYGSAKQIVAYLSSLDFSLLERDEKAISTHRFKPYRFQNSRDVSALFLALYRLKRAHPSLCSLFLSGYKNGGTLEGIHALQRGIWEHSARSSAGFRFLVGEAHSKSSPLKRWNMFLRWMVRKDELDLGCWAGAIPASELILPLDTHTFKVCKKLGILKRKSYDLKAALEATEFLKSLDSHDPIKYDFALYRLGQEREI